MDHERAKLLSDFQKWEDTWTDYFHKQYGIPLGGAKFFRVGDSEQAGFSRDYSRYREEYTEWQRRLRLPQVPVPGGWEGEPPQEEITCLKDLRDYLVLHLHDLYEFRESPIIFVDVECDRCRKAYRNAYRIFDQLGIFDRPVRTKRLIDPVEIEEALSELIAWLNRNDPKALATSGTHKPPALETFGQLFDVIESGAQIFTIKTWPGFKAVQVLKALCWHLYGSDDIGPLRRVVGKVARHSGLRIDELRKLPLEEFTRLAKEYHREAPQLPDAPEIGDDETRHVDGTDAPAAGGGDSEDTDPLEDVLKDQPLSLYLFLRPRKHWTRFDTLREQDDFWRTPNPGDPTIKRALRRLRGELTAIEWSRVALTIDTKHRRTKLDK